MKQSTFKKILALGCAVTLLVNTAGVTKAQASGVTTVYSKTKAYKYVNNARDLSVNRRNIVTVADIVANSSKWHYVASASAHKNCTRSTAKMKKFKCKGSKTTKYGIDSSGFISLVYNFAGFGAINFGASANIVDDSTNFEDVSVDEAKPGDILYAKKQVSSYPLAIFLGKSGKYVYTIQATGHSNLSCKNSISIVRSSAQKWVGAKQRKGLDDMKAYPKKNALARISR